MIYSLWAGDQSVAQPDYFSTQSNWATGKQKPNDLYEKQFYSSGFSSVALLLSVSMP
jgi:hypothetical protein